MKSYKCKNIRNIALVGHGGSGKTALAEALVFKSGGSDRLGRVPEGNTVCDYDPEEIKRKISLNTSLAYAEWKDVKINIADTPGQFDFIGGMYEGIRAAETVIIALPAKDGVQVGTIKAYNETVRQGKARVFAVTKTDEENADFGKALEGIEAQFGSSARPVIIPGGDGVLVNLLTMKAHKYDKAGNRSETALPAGDFKSLRSKLAEAVAETDEALMERFFESEGEDFTDGEFAKGVRDGLVQGVIAPVICCSAETLLGIDMILDLIADSFPAADETDGERSGDARIKYDESAPLAAYIFKTLADPFVGKMSFVKIITGSLSAKAEPTNSRTGETERFGKILALRGKKQDELTEAFAGDIVAVTKLDATTGDALCAASKIVGFNPVEFPVPCFFRAVSVKGKGDEGKISNALGRIIEEDLTLSYANNAETHQRVLGGLGEQHLDVAVSKMRNKFGVEVELSEPIIAYRETIRKKVVNIEGKHKKQSGGAGQFGVVIMEFEPHAGDELIFEERVFGGSVPKQFFPAVEKGLRESVEHGVLAGYPVVRLKATLVDGKYHPVDSKEIAFVQAARLAFKEGVKEASPCLLEPILSMKILVGDENTGDVMGIVNKRRGAVLGTNPAGGGMTVIEAEMPQAETSDFALVILQMTKGMGSFTQKFARYQELPQNLEAEVIANAPKRENN
ncbi:MAG: elongation factor G [Oscillospiraceae bacterium]|jgi:elongation factor G|nr:elongation factor G [Oscillospiraceae bacterium]